MIYTGLHQTPEMIVEAALQEDVDAIGLSILSGAHMTLFPAILDLLQRARRRRHRRSSAAASSRRRTSPSSKPQGVREIFTPGATTDDIVTWVRTQRCGPRA